MPSKLITTHPGKFFYSCAAAAYIAARLPFWMIYYLLPRMRPKESWSWEQAVRMRAFKTLLKIFWHVEMKTPESLKAGKEGKQFVVIEPAPSNCYTGVVLKDAEITPRSIGGTWYPAPLEKFTGNEDVVLHFHGGAYVLGDGRKDDCGHAATTILNNTSATHVFCPQYRLASNPNGQFPAALQDAITAIQHLSTNLAVPANRLTISGDSAGGNLALALLRYIHDEPEAGIASPGAAFLWSAWVNPSTSLIPGSFDHVKTDYLSEGFGAWGTRTLAPRKSTGLTITDPYIKCLGYPFSTPTPMFCAAGECEAILNETWQVYEELKAVPGNKVEVILEKGAPHDVLLVAPITGFCDTAIVTAKAAGKFLESLQR